MLKAMAIEEIRTGYRSPWMNPFVERAIGTVRPECTDHVIALGERHLQGVLREYVERYYNTSRTHMSLDGNSPIPRAVEPVVAAELRVTPVLGGRLHTCTVAA